MLNIYNKKEEPLMQGTTPDGKKPFDEWYKTVPKDRNDMSNYNLKRAYELAPMDELERWRTATPEQLKDDSYHLMTAYENPATGDYEFMKSKNHPTINKELDWYNGDTDDAKKFRSNYDLDTSGDYYKYVKKKTPQTDPTSVATPIGTVDESGSIIPNDADTQSNEDSAWLSQFDDEPKTPQYAPSSAPDKGMLDYIGKLYGDPEEDAKRERTNKQKMAILALGDAVRQMGNIYYTTKGAPSQKFNSPVKEEYERQYKDDILRQQQRQKAMEIYQKHMKDKADLFYKQRDDERKQRASVLAEHKDKRDQEDHGKKMEQYDSNIELINARTGLVGQQTTNAKNKDERDEKLNNARIKDMESRRAEARERIRQEWAKIEETKSYHRQQLSIQRTKGSGSKGGSTKTEKILVDVNNQRYKGPTDTYNEANATTLYRKLRSTYPDIRRAKNVGEKWAIIMENTHRPETIEFLKAMGYSLEN